MIMIDTSFIYAHEQDEIINIEYNTAHRFYFWARYIYYLKNQKEFKEIGVDCNFLFVLEDDLKNPSFYQALAHFLMSGFNQKPLISIGVVPLSEIETYLPKDFLDSSIWNFYIDILFDFSINKHPNFLEKLKNISLTLKSNQQNLYNLFVAKEFNELQGRLLANSYLGLKGGHAAAVTPFVFHSEQRMCSLSNKICKEKITVLLKSKQTENKHSFEWNILFIDDYAGKNLRGGGKTKKEILENLFKRLKALMENKNKKIEFHITSCYSIKNAKSTIIKQNNNKQFDIILLDYLLGQKTETSNKREYGDEFIHKLENNVGLLKKRGPLGKFWIFPVTSFGQAMISKLEEEGVGRIRDEWYIMDGADMINTPHLFMYNFLQLLYLQLNTAIITKEDIARFIMDNKTDSEDSEATNKRVPPYYSMREKARRLYGIFMHKFGLRGALRHDAGQGSAFAGSVLKYMHTERPDDLKFYESVRKLLYLVGYGTHTDTALMWDLLTYVNSVKDTIKFKENGIDKNEINIFLEEVRKYISELKNAHG